MAATCSAAAVRRSTGRAVARPTRYPNPMARPMPPRVVIHRISRRSLRVSLDVGQRADDLDSDCDVIVLVDDAVPLGQHPVVGASVADRAEVGLRRLARARLDWA